MRYNFSLGLMCVALLSGCTAITKDLRHPGGYPGSILDKRFFDATGSKQVQLFRAVNILAVTASISPAYVKENGEAEALITYMKSATNEINRLAGMVDVPVAGAAVTHTCRNDALLDDANTCNDFVALFEAGLPSLESKLVRVALAALPEDRARKFLGSVGEGNVLGAAWSAVRLAADALDGAHRGSSAYRSALEIQAVVLANSDLCKPIYDVKGIEITGAAVKSGITTTKQAVQCVGLSDAVLATHPNEAKWRELTVVPKNAFRAMFAIAETACRRLPIEYLNTDASVLTERAKDCSEIRYNPASKNDFLKTSFP